MSQSEPLLSHIKGWPHDSGSLEALEKGHFLEVLTSWQAQRLLHHEDLSAAGPTDWLKRLEDLIRDVASDPATPLEGFHGNDYIILASACLHAFLQANVTGPPLSWNPSDVVLPESIRSRPEALQVIRSQLNSSMSVDGEAVYRKVPYIELFAIAKLVCNHSSVLSNTLPARWARLRVNTWHQRLLSEPAPSLQKTIQEDIGFLDSSLLSARPPEPPKVEAHYLLEKAAVYTLHGEDKKAREALDDVAKVTGFKYVLTGQLGKRTKFQTFDISQLVVLAKSAGTNVKDKQAVINQDANQEPKPENIDLNDDTLLERISFTKSVPVGDPKIESTVPSELQGIDADAQPILDPLDSIHLLSLASSITNTSPSNGLTREETLPYVIRVLDGGSSNWQIYSQALLVRSRIEGFKSRTVERGVLQMQAIVDQVIAETTESNNTNAKADDETATTFLPRPKPSESASPIERLLYIHPLASPPRWNLEAELAERWLSIGGLRTALEIYERLEMWAEAALCHASLEDETKARSIISAQLYSDAGQKIEKRPLPNDAPRLFCILGDIDEDPSMYERAWTVSNDRYARAQRSLGKYYFKKRSLDDADAAYSKSLALHPQNSPAWFTLGCIRLELRKFPGAVDCFSRVVQREPEDAEAWSNLAAALLRLPPDEKAPTIALDDEDESVAVSATQVDPQKHVRQAFAAFKRAASLKRESHRIWLNLLNVGATLSPPPYNDIIIAQQRIIELRSGTEGEGCVDVEVMEGLLAHVIEMKQEELQSQLHANTEEGEAPERRRFGLEQMFINLVQKQITPLITHSRRLWKLVAKLSIHLKKPGSALEAYEKAWRVTLNQPGWDNEASVSNVNTDTGEEESSPDRVWRAVVDSTVELVDAYESLGEREVTEGLKAGSGELVCKNWKYKARMAVRSVMGRRTKAGMEGMEELEERMEMLKAG